MRQTDNTAHATDYYRQAMQTNPIPTPPNGTEHDAWVGLAVHAGGGFGPSQLRSVDDSVHGDPHDVHEVPVQHGTTHARATHLVPARASSWSVVSVYGSSTYKYRD